MKTIYYNPEIETHEMSTTSKEGFIKHDEPDSPAELEQRIADLEAKNTILEENMKILLDAIKHGKTNPNGNPPDPSPI